MATTGELKTCSLFVLRYVPDIVRNEGLNVGVLLHCPEDRYLGCRIASDFRRVRRFDARADLKLLGALQRDFENQIDEHEADLGGYLQLLTDSLSNTLQLDGPRACLLKDPVAEIGDVFQRYVESAAKREEGTRLQLKQRITAELVRAGVWEHLEKRIPAAPWTQPGDPFAFDYGYQLDRELKLIHAVAFDSGTQIAKTLAYTFGRIRMRETAHLTAVIPVLPGAPAEVAACGILSEAEIELLPLAEAPVLAQNIRMELGLHG